MKTKEEPEAPAWLDKPAVVGDKRWLPGKGSLPAKVMVVYDSPRPNDFNAQDLLTPNIRKNIVDNLVRCGIQSDEIYVTAAVKYIPSNKKIGVHDITVCRPLLETELDRCKPRFIVTFGGSALAAVLGKGKTISMYHGTTVQHPVLGGCTVCPMYSLEYISIMPQMEAEFQADWKALEKTLSGQDAHAVAQPPEIRVIQTGDEAEKFRDEIAAMPQATLVIDSEWDGSTWQDPAGYMRTLQIGYDDNKVAIFEFYDETGKRIQDDAGTARLWAAAKAILEGPNVWICGHNVRADGQWLMKYGVDIRKNVKYDTMIVEHLLDSASQFGLESLTTRYTDIGRYDAELANWVNEHKAECRHGYGAVPRDILLPYAAWDVEAPRRIMKAQMEKLDPAYMEPRGKYPSLFDVDMHAQDLLYEIEGGGLFVDKKQLDKLIAMYGEARSQLENKLTAMVKTLGIDDFNPGSSQQVSKLLFGVLGMSPITTTEGKDWSEIIDMPTGLQSSARPSTNKEVLTILADQPGAHPVVGLLRDYRKVSYICNQWLAPKEVADRFTPDERGGGLLAKIWPDGHIHSRFSQLKETARFSSAQPNVQNFTKKAEGELNRIICKDLGLVEKYFPGTDKIPSIKSIIVPRPGCVFMEADWKQAELFVLMSLSGDENMKKMLVTPGMDLHDHTACDSFHLTMLDPDDNIVTEEQLVELAAGDPNFDSEESAYSQFKSKLRYRYEDGTIISRKEMKKGLRVSAKSVSFGIAYGRSAAPIAIQIKAETGTEVPTDELEKQIDVMISAWKSKSYPDAWRFLSGCAEEVREKFELVNPWGRHRYFPPTEDEQQLAKMCREGMNYKIQSGVADNLLIALYLITEWRKKHKLNFRIVNLIHDAVLIETPIEEIEQAKEMFLGTMGNIDMPMPGGREPLRMGVDIEVMEKRWGG